MLRKLAYLLTLALAALMIGNGVAPAGQADAQQTEISPIVDPGNSWASATGPSLVGSDSETVSLPTGVSSNWWTSVQEGISQSEYRITWQDRTYLPDLPAAFQAPNRPHNLRTYFTPEGIRIIPRTGGPGLGARAAAGKLRL